MNIGKRAFSFGLKQLEKATSRLITACCNAIESYSFSHAYLRNLRNFFATARSGLMSLRGVKLTPCR
ncbi:hypothetical protein SELA5_p0053 (plasmid) [Salmonella enterica subsp. enterica serovar Enteritidis str. LA5]|nr:hypothetical protein SELA5_p0053 [Salmonella enterica subsp. enterica serovar Enteritidis str. LA5]